MRDFRYLIVAFTCTWLFCENEALDVVDQYSELHNNIWGSGIYFVAWRSFPKDNTIFTDSEYIESTEGCRYMTLCLDVALKESCYFRVKLLCGSNLLVSNTDVDGWYSSFIRPDYTKGFHPYERHFVDSDWLCKCGFTDVVWLTPNNYYSDSCFTAWTYGGSIMFMNQTFKVENYDLYEYNSSKEILSRNVDNAESRAFSIGGNIGFVSIYNFNKYIALRSYCQLYMLLQFMELSYQASSIIDATFPRTYISVYEDPKFNDVKKIIGITAVLPLEGNIDLLCYVSNLYDSRADIKIFFGKSYLYLPWQLYTWNAILWGTPGKSFVWEDGCVHSFMFDGWRLGIEVSW